MALLAPESCKCPESRCHVRLQGGQLDWPCQCLVLYELCFSSVLFVPWTLLNLQSVAVVARFCSAVALHCFVVTSRAFGKLCCFALHTLNRLFLWFRIFFAKDVRPQMMAEGQPLTRRYGLRFFVIASPLFHLVFTVLSFAANRTFWSGADAYAVRNICPRGDSLLLLSHIRLAGVRAAGTFFVRQ